MLTVLAGDDEPESKIQQLKDLQPNQGDVTPGIESPPTDNDAEGDSK